MRVRENARRSSCQSNLKQIGLGLTQYIQDYDEKLPEIYYGNPVYNSAGSGWPDHVYPYIKSTEVFNCPSKAKIPANYSGKFALDLQPAYITSSYGMAFGTGTNKRLGWTTYTNQKMISQSMVLRSSEIIYLADTLGTVGAGSNDGQYRVRVADPTAYAYAPPSFRHLETANFLFADGHVKALQEDKVMDANAIRNWDYSLE